MTTCLDPNVCPTDKLYNVHCNFSIGYINYICNSNTCMRADGTYDCCSINVVYCTIPDLFWHTPTSQPSIIIRETNCNQICSAGSKFASCYWYESLRTGNLCIENNNKYCCSHNREECCSINQTVVYIVVGCIAGIMCIFVYYWYAVKYSSRKVIPAKDLSDIEPIDRYKMIIHV
jgi:hypothetical protein